jgi:3-phenylpropionate/trans-cinnamate dioxygenase ferredoxin component
MTFERACAISDVPTDEALGVTIGAYDVAVAGHDGEYFAVQDLCSHAAVALSEGEVTVSDFGACTVECWLHGSRFDLRTGAALGLPATQPVPVYPVRVEAGDVLVDVSQPLTAP